MTPRGLRLLRWNEWQGRPIGDILRKRKARGGNLSAPLALSYVAVAVRFDETFDDFVAALPAQLQPRADALFLRVLQTAGLVGGSEGDLRYPPALFAGAVLARPWDPVSRKVGEVVFDALVQARIAVPLSAQTGAPAGADAGRPAGRPAGHTAGAGPDARGRGEKGREENQDNVVDVVVASDPGGTAAACSTEAPPEATATTLEPPECSRCDGGGKLLGSKKSCACPRGRVRAVRFAKAKGADEAQAAKAKKAAGRAPRHPGHDDPEGRRAAQIQALQEDVA